MSPHRVRKLSNYFLRYDLNLYCSAFTVRFQVTGDKLGKHGIQTVADLRKIRASLLEKHFSRYERFTRPKLDERSFDLSPNLEFAPPRIVGVLQSPHHNGT